MHYRMVTDGPECLLVEAARLTGKSTYNTALVLIKTGDLSTCSGERKCKNGRYFQSFYVSFGPFRGNRRGEHHSGLEVSEQRDTASCWSRVNRWFVIWNRRLNTWTPYFLSKDSRTLTAWNRPCSFLKITSAKLTRIPDAMVEILKNPDPQHASVFLSGHPGSSLNLPKNRQISERSSPLEIPTPLAKLKFWR